MPSGDTKITEAVLGLAKNANKHKYGDEYDSFGDYIAKKIRKLNHHKFKLEAEAKIFAILNEISAKDMELETPSADMELETLSAPNEDKYIHLKVSGQDLGHSIVQFKVEKNTPLMKLMNAYCNHVGVAIATILFRFDGQAVKETDTPLSLEMEEGDTMEVYLTQCGGLN